MVSLFWKLKTYCIYNLSKRVGKDGVVLRKIPRSSPASPELLNVTIVRSCDRAKFFRVCTKYLYVYRYTKTRWVKHIYHLYMFLAFFYTYYVTFQVILQIVLCQLLKSNVLTAQEDQLLEYLCQPCSSFPPLLLRLIQDQLRLTKINKDQPRSIKIYKNDQDQPRSTKIYQDYPNCLMLFLTGFSLPYFAQPNTNWLPGHGINR